VTLAVLPSFSNSLFAPSMSPAFILLKTASYSIAVGLLSIPLKNLSDIPSLALFILVISNR
jgi:hypothetical protein